LSRSSGSIVWRAPSDQVLVTATFGALFWGTAANGIDAFGRRDGRLLASFPASQTGIDQEVLPPVVAAGRVYVNLGQEILCLALPGSG
jgi:hypothetical protein